MNRTTAIIITVVTSLCCGLPGLGLICTGALAAIGGQSPEVLSQAKGSAEELYLGVALFLCGGLIMLVIPIVAGIVSFRMARPDDTAQVIGYNEPFPPAS